MKYVLTVIMVLALVVGLYANYHGLSSLENAITHVFLLAALLAQSVRISALEKKLK